MACIEAVDTEANPSLHHDVTPAHEPESASDICRLPFELLARVLGHLPLADRAHAAMSCSLMRHAINSSLPSLFSTSMPEAPVLMMLHSLRSAPFSPPSRFPLSPPRSVLPALTFLDLKAGSPCLNDAAFTALCSFLFSFPFPLVPSSQSAPCPDLSRPQGRKRLLRRLKSSFPFFPPRSLLPALTFLDLKAGSPCLNDAAFTALCSRLGAAGIGDGGESRSVGGAGIKAGGAGGECKEGMGKRGAGRKRGRAEVEEEGGKDEDQSLDPGGETGGARENTAGGETGGARENTAGGETGGARENTAGGRRCCLRRLELVSDF
ncbi:unnamed protein product [Closterium sp. Naga37s-1]|nr:unnamed protein product [Closterium sp. Naga37s-1]